jgi:hypothetical protein
MPSSCENVASTAFHDCDLRLAGRRLSSPVRSRQGTTRFREFDGQLAFGRSFWSGRFGCGFIVPGATLQEGDPFRAARQEERSGVSHQLDDGAVRPAAAEFVTQDEEQFLVIEIRNHYVLHDDAAHESVEAAHVIAVEVRDEEPVQWRLVEVCPSGKLLVEGGIRSSSAVESPIERSSSRIPEVAGMEAAMADRMLYPPNDHRRSVASKWLLCRSS